MPHDTPAALSDAATAKEAEASGDSPKRQGDKLGVAGSPAAEAAASSEAKPGASAKPHGDALEHAVDEAAGRG